MEYIRVKNLRSIVDSGNFRINNINLLLGKNSSGKSSILRMFPMIAESAKNELRGPLMWKSEYYDFGNFRNALNNKVPLSTGSMEFEFSWDISQDKKKKGFFQFLKNSNYITVKFVIAQLDKNTYLKQLVISAKDVLLLRLDCQTPKANVSCYLDDQQVSIGKAVWQYDYRGVIPNLQIHHADSEELDKLFQIQRRYNEYNNGRSVNVLMSSPLESLNIDNIKEQFRQKFAAVIDKEKVNEEEVLDLMISIYVPTTISSLLSYCDQKLSYYFSRVHYIAPLRYNRTRYSVENDLSVNRIDATGKNLVDFIISLEDKKKDSLNNFLLNTLNVTLDTQGDISTELRINNEDGINNLVDIGYGYTQLLPIAVTLWEVANEKSETEHTIVIEQPEVHLHPSLQSNLAHLFTYTIEEARKNKIDVRFLIETHSAYLVNRLGRYVYNKEQNYESSEPNMHKISPKDISIYLFNKENGTTNITTTEFDDQGRIKKWPLGFLD